MLPEEFQTVIKNQPDFIRAVVYPGGRVVIDDFTSGDMRYGLIAFLKAIGIDVEIKCDSWCG